MYVDGCVYKYIMYTLFIYLFFFVTKLGGGWSQGGGHDLGALESAASVST